MITIDKLTVSLEIIWSQLPFSQSKKKKKIWNGKLMMLVVELVTDLKQQGFLISTQA